MGLCPASPRRHPLEPWVSGLCRGHHSHQRQVTQQGKLYGTHSTAAYNGHIYAYNRCLLRALPGGGAFKEAKTVFSQNLLSTMTVKRTDLHSLIQPHSSGELNLGSTPLKPMHP